MLFFGPSGTGKTMATYNLYTNILYALFNYTTPPLTLT